MLLQYVVTLRYVALLLGVTDSSNMYLDSPLTKETHGCCSMIFALREPISQTRNSEQQKRR